MDIILLLKVLLRKWWLILGVPFICAIIAFFLVKNMSDVYKSSAQLSTGFTIDDQISLSEDKVNLRDVDLKFNNLIQNIKSNTVIYLLSYKLILHDLNNNSPFTKPQKEDFQLDEKGKTYALETFQAKLDSFQVLSKYNENDLFLNNILEHYHYDLETIRENLRIWRINGTDYVSLEYYSENPYLSAFAVNAICEEFIRYNRNIKLNQSVESISFFEDLLAEKKAELDEARQKLTYVKAANQIIDYQIEGQSKVNQLETLEGKKAEEERTINALNLSISDLNARIKSMSNGAEESDSKNQDIIILTDQIKMLNDNYINGGMKDENLLDSIKYLRSVLNDKKAKSANQGQGKYDVSMLNELKNKKFDLETQLKIAKSTLESILQTISNLKSNVSNFTAKESQIGEMDEEIELITKEYLNIQGKLNEARNQALLSGNTITQVQKGQPSDQPESSKKIMIVLLAWLGSFMLCVSTIIIFELLDLSLKNTEKFKQLIKLPLLGSLNSLPLNNYDVGSIFQDTKKGNDFEFFRQSLRKIRFEIEKQNKKVILMASPEKKEGKSFMLLSLANSLSLINKRILIIDTNFKNNTLTNLFVKKDKQLKNQETTKTNNNLFLLNAPLNGNKTEGQNDIQVSYDKFIIKTNNDAIDLIGNKPGSSSPSEIFAGKRFDIFLQEFSKIYDYIFLEGPSLNNFSDTKELIEYCDGIIGVFSADKVISQLDKESIEYFRNQNSKYLGSILNKVNLKNIN